MTQQNPSADRRSSLLGLLAIVLWSTTVAFSRSLTEQLGTLTAATLIYTVAGIAGLFFAWRFGGGLGHIRKLPRNYLIGCGTLFVLYIAALYLAIGRAETRTQVLAVGLINYLWPGLSLIFSIPILRQRARPLLPAGILLTLVGIWLATVSGSGITLQAMLTEEGVLLPYGLALAAAICWALYSTLSRRWAAGSDGGAVPLFLLASGLFLGIFRLFSSENSHWSVGVGFELMYMALFPGMLAYVLWDIAVRKGEIILVASLSYLTPLLSTLFSALILDVQPGAALWLGAGLLIAGAYICKISIYDPGTAVTPR